MACTARSFAPWSRFLKNKVRLPDHMTASTQTINMVRNCIDIIRPINNAVFFTTVNLRQFVMTTTVMIQQQLGLLRRVSQTFPGILIYNLSKHCPIFTARRSYASAVLGVVILSVCPSVRLSVCHTRAL